MSLTLSSNIIWHVYRSIAETKVFRLGVSLICLLYVKANELAKKVYDRKIKHITSYILPRIYCYLYITSYIFKKTLGLISIAFSKCGNKYQKIFKKEESIKILKILGLITNMEEHQKVYNHD